MRFQWRDSAGLWCYYQIEVGVLNLGTPIWLKLTRSVNDFSGYWSTNGVDYYQVGATQTVPLNRGGIWRPGGDGIGM